MEDSIAYLISHNILILSKKQTNCWLPALEKNMYQGINCRYPCVVFKLECPNKIITS